MNERTLDGHIEAYYRDESVSPERLAHLRQVESLARPTSPIGRFAPVGRRWVTGAALAAGLVAALLVVWPRTPSDPVSVARSAAAEIAKNHRKAESGESAFTSWAALRGELPRLEFDAVPVPLLASLGATARDTRYCSVQGQLAVRIHAETASGERLSVYQAQASGPLAEARTGRFEVGDLSVELERRGDVFVGVVGPSAVLARAP